MTNTSLNSKSLPPSKCLKLFILAVVSSLVIYGALRGLILNGPSKEIYAGIQSLVLFLLSLHALKEAGVNIKESLSYYNTQGYTSLVKAFRYLLVLVTAGILVVAAFVLADLLLTRWNILPADGLEKLLLPGENTIKKYFSEYLLSSRVRLFTFLISVGILAPAGEELFFRRLLYVGLREKHSFMKSALVSSVLFGALHGANWFPVFIKSVIISYFYEKDHNILSVVFLHGLINILAIVMLFFI